VVVVSEKAGAVPMIRASTEPQIALAKTANVVVFMMFIYPILQNDKAMVSATRDRTHDNATISL
jgi:hypothetical protein